MKKLIDLIHEMLVIAKIKQAEYIKDYLHEEQLIEFGKIQVLENLLKEIEE